MQTVLFPELQNASKNLHTGKIFPTPLPPLSPYERETIGGHLREAGTEIRRDFSRRKIGDGILAEADRFCNCGRQFSMLECIGDRLSFRVPMSCNSRICEVCGRRYARKLEPSIEELFKPLLSKKVKGYGLFLLTLTTSTDRYGPDGPTRRDIVRFYKESAKFLKLFYGKHQCRLTDDNRVIEDQTRLIRSGTGVRRRKPRTVTRKDGRTGEDWRRWRGSGYLASMELGMKNNMLHAHAVVYGPYIPIRKLRSTWQRLTGDSFIVDIRAINSTKRAARYVLKYIVKPPATDSLKALADYAIRIKSTRRIRSGGIFYNRLKRTEKEKLKLKCPHCGNWLHFNGSEIIDNVGDHDSQPLYPLLRDVRTRGSPLPLPEGHQTIRDITTAEIMERARQADSWLFPGKSTV